MRPTPPYREVGPALLGGQLLSAAWGTAHACPAGRSADPPRSSNGVVSRARAISNKLPPLRLASGLDSK